MSIQDPSGFKVTNNRVTLALGLIALLGVVWSAASYQQAQSYRISTVEAYIQDNKALNKQMVDQIGKLSEAVSALTFAIKGQPFTQKDAQP